MRSQHIPGAVLAIVRDDRVIYMQPMGVRDIEHNLPVTPDTLFPIGSCTKAFTSMEIARSADRGLLSLDDHPRKFLPYLKLADPEADAQITIRDMLSHRTGLKAYADLAAEPGVLTREEYIRAATSAETGGTVPDEVPILERDVRRRRRDRRTRRITPRGRRSSPATSSNRSA